MLSKGIGYNVVWLLCDEIFAVFECYSLSSVMNQNNIVLFSVMLYN